MNDEYSTTRRDAITEIVRGHIPQGPMTSVPVPEGYYSVAGAAKALGITHAALMQRLANHHMVADTVLVPALLIRRDEVERVRGVRFPRGPVREVSTPEEIAKERQRFFERRARARARGGDLAPPPGLPGPARPRGRPRRTEEQTQEYRERQAAAARARRRARYLEQHPPRERK